MPTIKAGDVVTRTLLHKRYWHGAAHELEVLKYVHDATYDKDMPEHKRGEARRYKVLRDLPTADALNTEAIAGIYTFTIEEALGDAIGDFEEIKDEMTEWRDNLAQSEGLSQTSKADEVRDAADALEYIDIPSEAEDVPEFLQDQEDAEGNITRPAFRVLLPTNLATWFPWRVRRQRTGRTARLQDASAVFSECADMLKHHMATEGCPWTDQEKTEAGELASSLQSIADELENIECPGMY